MAKTITITSRSTPGSFAGTPVVGVGTLPAGTYYYKIIAISAINGGIRSAPSAEISVVLSATGSVNLSWAAVASSYYMVWRTTVSGDYVHKTISGVGASYKCKMLRTAHNAVSSSTTTMTDNGSVLTTNVTQGIIHYEYYDYEIPAVNISGGDAADPFSMKYLYDQDVALGWGYITRAGDSFTGYTYTIKCLIYAHSACYWVDKDGRSTWIVLGGINFTSDSTIILGWESTNEEWLYGVRIIKPVHTGYYALPQITFAGTTSLYGCTFDHINTEYQGYIVPLNYDYSLQCGASSLAFSGNYIIKGCKFIGPAYSTTFTGGGVFLVERCDFSAGSRTFSLLGGDFSTGQFKDIYVKDGGTGINYERSIQTYATFVGGLVKAGLRSVQLAYAGADLTLVDTIFDEAKIQFYQGLTYTGAGATLHYQNRIDITVLDDVNVPIENVSVTMKNVNSVVQFSVLTDALGAISQQRVEAYKYYPADNTVHTVTAAEKTNYNPFILTISKAGYETYTEKVTISSQVTKSVTLKTSLKMRRGLQGEVYLAENPSEGSRTKIIQV